MRTEEFTWPGAFAYATPWRVHRVPLRLAEWHTAYFSTHGTRVTYGLAVCGVLCLPYEVPVEFQERCDRCWPDDSTEPMELARHWPGKRTHLLETDQPDGGYAIV